MIRSFLVRDHQRFGQGDFSQATMSFQRATERANGLEQNEFISSELVHARVKMGLICIHEGRLEESERIFSAIIDTKLPEIENCMKIVSMEPLQLIT